VAREGKMKIPDEVRKTVGFITFENKKNGHIVPVGSFFFLGHEPKQGATTSSRMYAVTARHIIDKLGKNGVAETVLRLNPKTQNAPLITITIPLSNWFVHPSDKSIDVAITEMGIPSDADHLVMPISLCATEKVFLENEVELGEEVFVSGLFRHHYGNRKNIPIIRVGNLAALSDEKITTKSFGEIEGYQSWSRLSEQIFRVDKWSLYQG
jgi:hypothetical protein